MAGAARTQGSREIALIGAGGVLLAVSPFLPWIHVVLLGNLNLFQLINLSHGSPGIGYALSAAGVAVALAAALGMPRDGLRAASIAVGVIAGLLGGDYGIGLIKAVHESNGLASAGTGIAVAILAVILLIVPAVVLRNAPGSGHPGAFSGLPAAWPAAGGRDAAPSREPRPAWQVAAGAALLALVCSLGLAFIPAGTAGQSCANPVSSLLASPLPLPTDPQPAQDAGLISSDQAALGRAQDALARASTAEGTARDLSSKAQDAQSQADGLASQVSGDQSTIDGDQNTISSDNSTIQTDTQTLQQDQSQGGPTQADQMTLAQDQATLAKDQATLSHDKGVLSNDQQAAAAASSASKQLTAQSSQAGSRSPSSSDVQQQVDSAQQQLQQDQQQQTDLASAWQAQHDRRVSDVSAHNRVLAACQGRAQPRVILATAVLLGGLTFAGIRLAQSSRATAPRA